MSYFTEIKPTKTKNITESKKWKFMLYQELSSERDDGIDYCAFLFRDNERFLFGIKEFFGDDIPCMNKFRDLATKVLLDTSFRKSLLSESLKLPQLWKKH